MFRKKVLPIFVVLACLLLASLFFENAQAEPFAQQPTGSIATVTGTPPGFTVTVGAQEDQINVRSGPGLDFPLVGILVAGQVVPALGRSPGGDWVQIVYPGVPGGHSLGLFIFTHRNSIWHASNCGTAAHANAKDNPNCRSDAGCTVQA